MSDRLRRVSRIVLIGCALELILVAVVIAQHPADAQRSLERETATATANVAALSSRVVALEDVQIAQRLALLESFAKDAREDAADQRRLLYSVIAGVTVQLLVTTANLRRPR